MKNKLVAPSGAEIIGLWRTVDGSALIQDLRRTREGSGGLEFDFAGETKLDWDTAQDKLEEGERLFEDAQHFLWRESQLITRQKSAKLRAQELAEKRKRNVFLREFGVKRSTLSKRKHG